MTTHRATTEEERGNILAAMADLNAQAAAGAPAGEPPTLAPAGWKKEAAAGSSLRTDGRYSHPLVHPLLLLGFLLLLVWAGPLIQRATEKRR